MRITATPRQLSQTPRRAVVAATMVALVSLVLAACQPDNGGTNYTAINSLRASVAVPELARTGELDVKAQAQADRMAKRGAIYHSTNMAAGVSPGWSLIGENVASAGSVEAAEAALEASPPHYENLTNPAFNQVGIGVTVKNGVYYVVQVFVSR